MQEVFISLATSGNVNLTPDLPGLTGGESNGSTTFTVTTDSPSGYQLTIKAENNPAMQSGVSTIADYDAGAVTDFRLRREQLMHIWVLLRKVSILCRLLKTMVVVLVT